MSKSNNDLFTTVGCHQKEDKENEQIGHDNNAERSMLDMTLVPRHDKSTKEYTTPSKHCYDTAFM